MPRLGGFACREGPLPELLEGGGLPGLTNKPRISDASRLAACGYLSGEGDIKKKLFLYGHKGQY